ncbi:MAG: hypothetical protein FJY80_05645 [Candidatus Aminicenantes bacterium]|nr:hypothetical protein [Candidatus Aminicenantes bacterium]
MKKAVLLLLALSALAPAAPADVRWQAGLAGGWRTLKDSTLQSVYGGGWVFVPWMSYRLSRTLWVGAEFEGGYVQKAKIGLFAEESRLAVRGMHAFLFYGPDKGRIRPFLKVGAGLFAFKMDIDSPYVQAANFASNDVSILVGGGLKVMLGRKLFVTAEVKYAALWADPFDDMVDLGGIRFLAGIGLDL